MKRIHIVNPFWNPYGGSELRAIALAKALGASSKVELWSHVAAHPLLANLAPIRLIKTNRLDQPFGGTLVIVGAYFALGKWINFSMPKRTVLIYNTPDPHQLEDRLNELRRAGHGRVEIVYSSEGLKQSTGIDGEVEVSLIDTEAFSPSPTCPQRPFTVGRLSRDEPTKHHENDAALYRALAACGIHIRIMGASADLTADLAGTPNVQLLRPGEMEAPEFLHTIDCLYYRTSETWFETWGRVVLEAMAAGLPVVCGRRGGYADVIEHGVNGYLIDSEAEAEAIIKSLRESPALRARIGAAARATAEDVLAKGRARLVRFYTGSAAPS